MRLAILHLLFGLAAGSMFYTVKVPNGDNVLHNGQPWPALGHMFSSGSGPNNQFGLDFKSAGYAWTETLCRTDSDADGRSNGEELGDPECVWTEGSKPTRSTGITHPGIHDFKFGAQADPASPSPLVAPSLIPLPVPIGRLPDPSPGTAFIVCARFGVFVQVPIAEAERTRELIILALGLNVKGAESIRIIDIQPGQVTSNQNNLKKFDAQAQTVVDPLTSFVTCQVCFPAGTPEAVQIAALQAALPGFIATLAAAGVQAQVIGGIYFVAVLIDVPVRFPEKGSVVAGGGGGGAAVVVVTQPVVTTTVVRIPAPARPATAEQGFEAGDDGDGSPLGLLGLLGLIAIPCLLLLFCLAYWFLIRKWTTAMPVFDCCGCQNANPCQC